MSTLRDDYDDDPLLDLAGTPLRDSDSGGFQVDDDRKADWAVRKIRHSRRQLARAEALYADEKARLDAWIDKARADTEQTDGFFTELLARYHRRLLDDDPKAKTVSLPAGDLVARKQPDTVDYIDLDAFVEWAQANRPELVRVKVEADRAEVKRRLRPSAAYDEAAGGSVVVVDPDTGEPVPGVAWVEGDVRFTVKTEAEATEVRP